MTQFTTNLGRTARRLAILAVPLLAAVTGTAAAHGGGSYGGGMMGGGWGLFGGAMGLWGHLWMGLLIAVPLYVVCTGQPEQLLFQPVHHTPNARRCGTQPLTP